MPTRRHHWTSRDWDLFGKAVGMPVCELVGGRTGMRMPVISSFPAGDPEDMRERVAEHRARGHTAHSVKIDDEPAVNAALRTLRLLPPGLTRGRRQARHVRRGRAHGSDVAFAPIVHLGQTVPARLLRCVLESRDIVSVTTADGDYPVVDGRVVAPDAPGPAPGRAWTSSAPVAIYGD